MKRANGKEQEGPRVKSEDQVKLPPAPEAGTPNAPRAEKRSPALWLRSAWLAPLLLVAAIFTAYANGLGGPFVYDDLPSIVNNPTLRAGTPLRDVLLPPNAGGATVAGRPVLNVSFALNHAISGDAVWSYHLFNVAIHAAAALVLFGLARRTFARMRGVEAGTARGLALALAALWALHPLQTQAITYTVQRAESLMGLFYLFTIYALVRGVDPANEPTGESQGAPEISTKGIVVAKPEERTTKNSWLVASVIACLFGMATKEVMATAPLLVLLYDRTFIAGSFRAAWVRRRGYYVALAATWIVLGALVASTGGNRGGSVGIGVGASLWAYPLTQFEAVVRYLGLSVWPRPLVFEYGTFWVQRASEVLPWALVLVPLLALTIWALVKKPLLGFVGAWFFVILAPSSLAPGTTQMIVEHRMYLSLAAVMALIVVALYRSMGRKALVVCAVAALGLGALTAARNHDYRTALALWSDTLAKRPDSTRTRENLADALAQAGRLHEAIAQHEAAVRLKPDDPELQYNLALALTQADRWTEAITHYQAALQVSPDGPSLHSNLALALGHIGDLAGALQHAALAAKLAPENASFRYNYALFLDAARRLPEAVEEYEAALRLRPDYPEAHNNLGNALLQLGRPAEAIAHYETLLRVRPESLEARSNLGLALVKLGRAAEAAPHFEAVLKAQPADFAAHMQLGQIALAASRAAEALGHFEAALRAKPESVDALTHLGRALAQSGRMREAVAAYERALRIAPGATGTRYNLANALFQLGEVAAAARAYEDVLRALPDYNDARFNLAASLVRLNRVGDAIAAYEEILRRAPDDATAHAELANLLAHTGRTADAIAHYETALRLKPDFAIVREQLARLRTGR